MAFSPFYKTRQKSGYIMLAIAFALILSNSSLLIVSIIYKLYDRSVILGFSLVVAIFLISAGRKKLDEYKQYKFSYEQYIFSLMMTGQIDRMIAESYMIGETNESKDKGNKMIWISIIGIISIVIIILAGISVGNRFFDSSVHNENEVEMTTEFLFFLFSLFVTAVAFWVVAFFVVYLIIGIIKSKEKFELHN